MNVYMFTVWYETEVGVDTYNEAVLAESEEAAKAKLVEESTKLAKLGMGRFEIGSCSKIASDVII